MLHRAGWRYDLKMYLHFAAMHVHDGKDLIGKASYDERFGANRLEKYRPASERIAHLLDRLLARAH